MTPMSYSMRALLAMMACVALVTTSLVYPSPALGDLFYTVGLLTVGVAILFSIYSRGPRRAYWIGFTLLFVGYFSNSVWPSELRGTLSLVQRLGRPGSFSQGLITTRLLQNLYELLHGPMSASGMPTTNVFRSGQMTSAATAMSQYASFFAVGHTTIAFLFGVVGGTIARRIALRSTTTSNTRVDSQ